MSGITPDLLRGFYIFSIIYTCFALCVGIGSLCYQSYCYYQSRSKNKVIFLIHQVFALTALSLRSCIMYLVNPPTTVLLISYTYTFFFEILLRPVSITESLKLFAPLTNWINKTRIYILHGCIVFGHFATMGGLLFYYILFQYPTEDNFFAKWLRYGSSAGAILQAIFIFCQVTYMCYLMVKYTRAQKTRAEDYKARERKVFFYLSAMAFVYFSAFTFYLSGVSVDSFPGSPGNRMYQILTQMNITHAMFNAILNPLYFDSIIGLKFSKERRNSVIKKKSVKRSGTLPN